MEGNDGAPFGNNSFTINNQNLEEAEELIDRQRREEEIQNLLTHAMGDFDYDKTDSINVSLDEQHNLPESVDYEKQYRESNVDEQLKILYEVRVREVLSLTNEVKKLKDKFREQTNKLKTQVTLLEIDVERKNISLQEAQSLLVEKVEQIRHIESEVKSLKFAINTFENQCTELNEEKIVLQNLNVDLQQQLSLMEKGFPLLNKTTDRDFQESQKNKIIQLENTLDAAITQAERKERQHKELLHELKQSLSERNDDLAEKNVLINRLNENLDDSQRRCQELARIVEDLKHAEKVNKGLEKPLEEELRKIREHNERTNIISENVKKALSEEFQSHMGAMFSDNQLLRDTISKQEVDLGKAAQKIQMLSVLESENQAIKVKFLEIEDQLKVKNVENDSLKNQLNTLKNQLSTVKFERDTSNQQVTNFETERNAAREEKKKFLEQISLIDNLNEENATLRNKLSKLELYINEINNPLTSEQSIQASFSYIQHVDFEKLEREKVDIGKELELANTYIEELENKMKSVSQENSQLKVKVELETERENLIKSLQEKAAQFENIILERQMELQKAIKTSIGVNTENVKTTISRGVNTDQVEEQEQEDTASVLKVKYDSLLFQTETKLRKELKKEFDDKLSKLMVESDKKVRYALSCESCKNMKIENKKLSKLREKDREAVKSLVEVWISKFADLENHMQNTCDNLRTVYERQLMLLIQDLEQSYIHKFNKNKEELEKRIKTELEQHKSELTQRGILLHNVFNTTFDKIGKKIRKGGEEVLAVQRQHLSNISALNRSGVS